MEALVSARRVPSSCTLHRDGVSAPPLHLARHGGRSCSTPGFPMISQLGMSLRVQPARSRKVPIRRPVDSDPNDRRSSPEIPRHHSPEFRSLVLAWTRRRRYWSCSCCKRQPAALTGAWPGGSQYDVCWHSTARECTGHMQSISAAHLVGSSPSLRDASCAASSSNPAMDHLLDAFAVPAGKMAAPAPGYDQFRKRRHPA